jgi:predicted porin
VLLPFTARREIGARIDAVSNFILTEGLLFNPTYFLTDKVSLNARFETYTRQNVGDPFGQQSTNVVANDRVNSFGFGGKYEFARNVFFTAAYQHDRRSSSDPTQPFTNNLFWLGVQGGI